MKVVLDTSILVQIERKDEEVIRIIKKLIERGDDILISTVTVSEILTGVYLRKDLTKSMYEAKRVLSQFLWVDVSGKIAEQTAKYLAFLIINGKSIEYQDVAIAATFSVTNSDYLLTLNKSHFINFPDIKNKVNIPEEFIKIIK